MTACLLHNDDLDALESLAKEYLLKIPNRNIPKTIWPKQPFKPSQMKVKIFVVPVRDIFHVNLTFPRDDDMLQHYASSPESYLVQMLGYKGPGGLFAHLRRTGLAIHLVASCRTFTKGLSFFMVSIQLTQAGERRVDEVVTEVFQYLQLIKGEFRDELFLHLHYDERRRKTSSRFAESGLPKYFFDEIQALSEQQFEHKEPDRVQRYVSDISFQMQLYPPEDILVGDYLIRKDSQSEECKIQASQSFRLSLSLGSSGQT